MANSTQLGIVTDEDLVRIKDLVVRDAAALGKWGTVVDHIVQSGVDELQIKNMLFKQLDYAEAVLRSLRLWYQNSSGNLKDLVSVLRADGLNALADKIQTHFGARRSPEAPIWFEVGDVVHNFTGRETELTRLHELLTESHSTESSTRNMVSICGLGGVGKSTLARKYAFVRKSFYKGNVVWIHAASVDSMRSSFLRLASHMGTEVPLGAENKEIAAQVYQWFANRDRKCLLIFDNVEEKTDLRHFKPRITDPEKETPYVLVTSREQDLTPVSKNQLQLTVLNVKQATELMKGRLSETTGPCRTKLAQKLQMYPLALQQAVAYIQSELGNDNGAIEEYLQEFDTCAAELLNDDRFQEDDLNEYSLTTFTTWTLTLKRIQTNPGGSSSIKMIHMLAHLNPDRITVEFLSKIFKESTKSALRRLVKFSMVDLARGVVTIHRLVQRVIKLQMSSTYPSNPDQTHVTDMSVATATVTELAKVIASELEAGGCALSEYLEECVAHGKQLSPVGLNKDDIPTDFFPCFEEVCVYLSEYDNGTECLAYASQLRVLLENICGHEHLVTRFARLREAQSLMALQKYSEAMQILGPLREVCGPINQATKWDTFGGFSLEWLTVYTLACIANVHAAMGNHNQALDMCNTLISCLEHTIENVQAQDFGRRELVGLEHDKGNVIHGMGCFAEALEWFQTAHRKAVDLFGEKHLQTLLSKNMIAITYIGMEEYVEAHKILLDVMDAYKNRLGDLHPRTRRAREKVTVLAQILSNEPTNLEI